MQTPKPRSALEAGKFFFRIFGELQEILSRMQPPRITPPTQRYQRPHRRGKSATHKQSSGPFSDLPLALSTHSHQPNGSIDSLCCGVSFMADGVEFPPLSLVWQIRGVGEFQVQNPPMARIAGR